MGLDLLRLPFVKVDGKLLPLNGYELGQKNTEYYNIGKGIVNESIIERDEFNRGFPEGLSDNDKEILNEYGSNPTWITLKDLNKLILNERKLFFEKIKTAALEHMVHPNYDNFYTNYDWDDLDINSKFDDDLACLIYRYELYLNELNSLNAINEYSNDHNITNDKDIYLIYIYNT